MRPTILGNDLCCLQTRWKLWVMYVVRSRSVRTCTAHDTSQRGKLQDADLYCMAEVPPLKMRTTLMRFMVEKFDLDTQTFIVQQNQDAIFARGVDLQCIYGLQDEGLNINSILYEEGEDAKNNIPGHYLSKRSGNLVIDELIS